MGKLDVVNIQRGCVFDGPGVRTTVFLKGCGLHCPWCCNPEAAFGQGHSTLMDAETLAAGLMRDLNLFARSGGGVTFSGGEPLLQAEALAPVMEVLADRGVSIWLETALIAPGGALKTVLPFVEGLIVDFKLQTEMHPDDRYLGMVSDALEMAAGKDLVMRMVFVNSVWTDRERVAGQLRSLGVRSLELLCCHDLAASKYKALGLGYVGFSPDKDHLESFSSYLREMGIDNEILSV